jgi:hypothetical protein
MGFQLPALKIPGTFGHVVIYLHIVMFYNSGHDFNVLSKLLFGIQDIPRIWFLILIPGWCKYRVQGACIEKRRIIFRYQFFLILLKFNVFFLVGIAAQYFDAIYFASKDSPDLATRRTVYSFLWAGLLLVITLAAYY